MKIFKFANRSFAYRLSMSVILTAAIVLLGVAALLQQYVKNIIVAEEEARTNAKLETVRQRVNTMMMVVETSVANHVGSVVHNLDKPELMYGLVREIVERNPVIVGAAVAFEPNFYPSKGIYFSPYAYQSGDSICTKQLGTENYDYHSMEWYVAPKQLKHGTWSEPYFDEGGGEMLMVTYSLPLKNEKGESYAVMTADVSIKWLSEVLDSLSNTPYSYNFVMARNGSFIVHPASNMILNETCFTLAEQFGDTLIASVGRRMLAGETGMARYNDFRFGSAYLFYMPIERTGWSMAIVCDAQEMFAPASRVGRLVVGIIFLGLLLLSFVCYRMVRIVSNPLEHFARSAKEISRGNFNASLPEIKSRDEMYQLRQSFATMQTSLIQQMKELEEVNAQKGRIESELKIAREIQMSMLPKVFPPYPQRKDIDIYGRLTPAKEVGGDLFDFYLRDEKLFFCVGDVSGKGVPASLVMAVSRTQFRMVSTHESAPERILKAINEIMCEGNESNMFVTLFVGVLDLPTGRLRYSNAGHDSPLFIGSGVGVLPCDSNIPVGVMGGWDYTQQESLIAPGTTIFLYTDGLTEAENTDHAQFGEQRLFDTAREAWEKERHAPDLLVASMTDSVRAFVGDAEQSDDLTMLAIQYLYHQENIRFQRSLTLPNDVQKISSLARFIDAMCEELEFDMSTTMQMNLAVEEAVVNVMNYAYPAGRKGFVNIEAKADDEILRFVIVDSGVPFDPTSKGEVDTELSAEEREIGGLGIHLIRQLMDSINYERVDGKNVLTLIKRLK